MTQSTIWVKIPLWLDLMEVDELEGCMEEPYDKTCKGTDWEWHKVLVKDNTGKMPAGELGVLNKNDEWDRLSYIERSNVRQKVMDAFRSGTAVTDIQLSIVKRVMDEIVEAEMKFLRAKIDRFIYHCIANHTIDTILTKEGDKINETSEV